MIDSLLLQYIFIENINIPENLGPSSKEFIKDKLSVGLENYVSDKNIEGKTSLDKKTNTKEDNPQINEIIKNTEILMERVEYQISIDMEENYVSYYSLEEFDSENGVDIDKEGEMILSLNYISSLYDGLDPDEKVFIFWQACIARLPRELWYMSSY